MACHQRKLRAAIIGCGGIAQVHQKVLMSLAEAELVACCDIRLERAEAMAQACGARAYRDAEEMLRGERLDVVHLCVPHPLHTPLAQLATRYGVHVFTEKPPVVSRAQWEAFEALEHAGVRVGVCFQNRYNAAVRAMQEILNAPESGRVLGARAFVTWMRTPEYYTQSDWRGSWSAEGGGELINQSIHTLDLLVQLLGKPAQVECTMRNHSLKGVIEVEDTVEAYIGFESGAKAIFYGTNAYCANEPVTLDIVCEHVRLRMYGQDLTICREGREAEHPVFRQEECLGKGYWGNGHYTCIQDFYQSVLEDRPYRNDIASTRDTMQLMLGMYEPYMGRTIDE